jgi:hypothetical protein
MKFENSRAALRMAHRKVELACTDMSTANDRGMFALIDMPVHEADRMHSAMLRIEAHLEGAEAILQGIIDDTITTEG